MASTVKHFSLHRIGQVLLRVVADSDEWVIPLAQAEQNVISALASHPKWQHQAVTLFVLEDLQPLIRQLPSDASLAPGGVTLLDRGPVFSAYDLANPTKIHVFVNRTAMKRDGYWHDLISAEGLLAHEHAHPLAENQTVSASRRLQLEITCVDPTAPGPTLVQDDHAAQPLAPGACERIRPLLAPLAERLGVYAPRELFANEVAIDQGYCEALFHLNVRNMENAVKAVAARAGLRDQLQQSVARGTHSRAGAAALLLVADLDNYLDLAIEVAPFIRAGRERKARQLEATLKAEVFPKVEPEVAVAFAGLCSQYVGLKPDMTDLTAWSEAVLSELDKALSAKGVRLQYAVGPGRR